MNTRQLAGMVLWGASLAAVPASAQQADFTFYSPLAEDWYRAAQTFEWTVRRLGLVADGCRRFI